MFSFGRDYKLSYKGIPIFVQQEIDDIYLRLDPETYEAIGDHGVRDIMLWIKSGGTEKIDKEREERERLDESMNEDSSPKPEKKAGKPGYVYLLKSDTGHWKIGKAKNPKNRIDTFNVKLPFQVEFEHLIKTDDMKGLEEQLHVKFSSKRISGEWFDLNDEDIAYIKGL